MANRARNDLAGHRPQKPAELIARDFVTLARCTFKSRSVDDVYRPMSILDEARVLQRGSRNGDSGPTGPEHHGEELLRKRQPIYVDAVARHQEPPCTSFVNAV